MESSATIAIITLLGAGLLGMIGYFIQRISADIRNLGNRMDARMERMQQQIHELLIAVKALGARLDGHEVRINELEQADRRA